MVFLRLILAVSLALCGLALFVPGWSDLLLLGGPSAFAAGWLSLRLWRARPTEVERRDIVVVDGSNVMHWRDGKPALAPVRDLLAALDERNIGAIVVFDANAGYLLEGRYLGSDALARRLSLPARAVEVVSRGEPADPRILALARDLGGRVVSNDRFRDWHEAFPQAAEPGHVLRGGYREDRLAVPSLA